VNRQNIWVLIFGCMGSCARLGTLGVVAAGRARGPGRCGLLLDGRYHRRFNETMSSRVSSMFVTAY
jgi:hypothetical protein